MKIRGLSIVALDDSKLNELVSKFTKLDNVCVSIESSLYGEGVHDVVIFAPYVCIQSSDVFEYSISVISNGKVEGLILKDKDIVKFDI